MIGMIGMWLAGAATGAGIFYCALEFRRWRDQQRKLRQARSLEAAIDGLIVRAFQAAEQGCPCPRCVERRRGGIIGPGTLKVSN